MLPFQRSSPPGRVVLWNTFAALYDDHGLIGLIKCGLYNSHKAYATRSHARAKNLTVHARSLLDPDPLRAYVIHCA